MAVVSLSEAAVVLSLGFFLVFAFRTARKVLSKYLTPIRHLRGPPSKLGRFIQGNLLRVHERVNDYLTWVEEYGNTFVLRGPFQIPVLLTVDMRTINHVLTHSMDYHKPENAQRRISRFLGNGVLLAEGEKHRQQRRIMNPAFGPAQIRELTDTFHMKANELCEFWNARINSSTKSAHINVMDGLSKMTLDVIGLAGFNYRFEAMNPDLPPNELNVAFGQVFMQRPQKRLLLAIADTFPSLLPVMEFLSPGRGKLVANAKAVTHRIARQIVEEKKAEILREHSKGSDHIEKTTLQGRDLLTLLIKANMATDIPESQRMTEEEVISQIPTFLIAGHETTSNATTWCLYSLTQAPDVQRKLREELLTVATDTPSMDELQALPYLDLVVRETLRLWAPVSAVARVAMKDDVLPLSEPVVYTDGSVHHDLHVTQGTTIIIPIAVLHTSRAIWGDDALEFRPERWSSPPETIAGMPGVWGHLLTFIGGPHACIGYRFSLIELKALMFTLIRSFEFELAVNKDDITYVGPGAIRRPFIRGEVEKGPQLPLIIRPYKRD